jgi:hypothetical protein
MNHLYRCVVIASGILLLALDLRDISKRRMDIAIGSWWAVLAMIVIVFGVVFDFASLRSLIRFRNLVLLYLFAVSLVTALYLYGKSITRLKKECAELAMWVSYEKSLKEAAAETSAGAEDGEQAGAPS